MGPQRSAPIVRHTHTTHLCPTVLACLPVQLGPRGLGWCWYMYTTLAESLVDPASVSVLELSDGPCEGKTRHGGWVDGRGGGLGDE